MPSSKSSHRSLASFSQPAPEEALFRGRIGDPRLGDRVQCFSELEKLKPGQIGFAIFGNPDDLGVRLNRGRAGAKSGPDTIRRHLYKMTLPMDFDWPSEVLLIDLGNIIVSSDILETHSNTREMARTIARAGYTAVVLGGGHDFAYPSFAGHIEGNHTPPKASVGLINVDPHLDVRELENGLPHSGTPFRQLLDEGLILGKNLVEFGSRANRNARAHFQYCQQQQVNVIPLDSIRSHTLNASDQYRRTLKTLVEKLELVGATFDMDSCCDSEGMSAAPVVGFSAWELVRMAESAGELASLRHFEIAEVAPTLDPHERSSRIAAEMVYAFLSARIRSRSAKPKQAIRKAQKNSKRISKA